MKIESTDQDIRNLFSSGYYRIPRFQRPYSWTRENIQEFWDDVVRDAPSDYFIGSMVVFKEGSQRYGVVDGQQRLTTIAILLAVLRNSLAARGFRDLAEGIHGLIERKNIDNRQEFTLSTESSYPFFQDCILKWGEPEVPVVPMREEENLQNAFEQFTSLVGGIIADSSPPPPADQAAANEAIRQKLTKVRDSILDLKAIVVKLDNEDDAYIIFETLNTRGKDLSLTDLVKNHITKHIKEKSVSVDQTKVKWQKVLRTIEDSSCGLDTDTFIHHFWLSRYDYLPAKSLFKELKRRIGQAECKAFLDNLVSDAALYRAIHDISYGKWSKPEDRIAEGLRALQLFRVQQQTPCVLSLVRAYKEDQRLKKRHMEEALVAIEKFHFLFTAVTSQRSSGGISGMYASLGRRLFEAEDLVGALRVLQELKTKLRSRVPSQAEVRALFPEIVCTDNLTKQRALVKYILAGFEKNTSSGFTTDFDKMTIEHMVPQSQIASGTFTDLVVGQLGNLVLVSPELNQRLANKSFKDKKRILNGMNFPLPKEMQQATEWTAEDIKSRTDRMAVLAYEKVWKI